MALGLNWAQVELDAPTDSTSERDFEQYLNKLRRLSRNGILNWVAGVIVGGWVYSPANVAIDPRLTWEGPLSADFVGLPTESQAACDSLAASILNGNNFAFASPTQPFPEIAVRQQGVFMAGAA